MFVYTKIGKQLRIDYHIENKFFKMKDKNNNLYRYY